MESLEFDLHAYEPPISLWSLVEQHIPGHETEEIKNMLGESLVDNSIELHQEVETLLEIWRDYRDETTNKTPRPFLPEPPGLRNRLVQEIQFFVENVKEKAKNQGVNPDSVLSRHNTDILDYALDTCRPDSARPSSRLSTARNSDGRETPMVSDSSLSNDRASAASTLSEEVESMNDKLTVLKFDEVVTHLRSTLEEEVEALLKDINFLQNCLDDEATFRAESDGTLRREPTITALREERSTLEKEMLSSVIHQTPPPRKNVFSPSPSIKSLGPSTINIPSKLKVSPSVNSTARVGPMKAFTSPDSMRQVPSPPARPGDHITHTESSIVSHKRVHRNISSAFEGKPCQNDKHSGRQTESESSSLVSSNRSVLPSSSGAGSRGRDMKPREKSSKPVLGAVVTLSKGESGDRSEVHVIPTPPTSAKSTTQRPGSAQRFRQMVMNCRD